MTDDPNQIPAEMIRYCIHCREQLDEKRTIRGSIFCAKPECRSADRKARRQFKASRNCRLCGRRARRPRACAPSAHVEDSHSEERTNL